MQGMQNLCIYSGYGPDGVTYTCEVDFGPGFLVNVQSVLAWCNGGGLHQTGIAGFRYRDTPDGPDIPVNYGDWWNWQTSIWQQDMTAVVFGTVVGGNNQECMAVANIFYW